MNQKEIAKLHQRDLNRYLKFANREFYKGLKNQVEPILIDINQQVNEEPLRQAYLKVYEKIGVDSAKKEYYRIKKQEGLKVDLLLQLLFNTWSSWMRDYVQAELGFLITQVTQNTQNKINQALQDSLEAGDTREQTAKRIYKYTLGEIGRTRARLIGRTESTRANNVGKRRSADDWQQLNPQNPMYKKWIHVPQRQNRDFHVLEGRKPPIPIDESFEVYDPQSKTITVMEQPGDVSAPASQTCNCGCTCVYMSERVARRNFDMTSRVTMPPISQTPTIPLPLNTQRGFIPAKTIEQARQQSVDILNDNTTLRIGNTQFNSSLNLDQLNKYNKQIKSLTEEYNLSPHLNKDKPVSLQFNSSMTTYGFVEHNSSRIFTINFGHRFAETSRINGRLIKKDSETFKFSHNSQVDSINKDVATVTHEFAHVISSEHKLLNSKYPELNTFWKGITRLKTNYNKEIKEAYIQKDINRLNEIFLGSYANKNKNEFMAEAFTEYKLNSNPSKYAIEVGKLIDKYFKKK